MRGISCDPIGFSLRRLARRRVTIPAVLLAMAVFARPALAEQIYLHCTWAAPPGVQGETLDFVIDTTAVTMTFPNGKVAGPPGSDAYVHISPSEIEMDQGGNGMVTRIDRMTGAISRGCDHSCPGGFVFTGSCVKVDQQNRKF